ncbi:MAG: ChbG/HpnK family deacetylase [Acidobacteriota bacterium]
MNPEKYVIFNADDFGASAGVNRGIVECHRNGVLTSTSFMVTGRSADEAVAMSRDNPDLAIGLHWDVWGEDEREFSTSNHQAVRDEFRRQLGEFDRFFGRLPSHVDSHRHAHREVFELFRELVEPLGVPLREDGRVKFIGGFYAQWEWMVTNLQYVSVAFLEQILRTEIEPGFTEVSCHPGYVTPDYQAVYLAEREEEVRTITSPRIKDVLKEEGIRLISYADYNRLCAVQKLT